MLPLVHIPVQPSSQNCLAWSSDGELAVAAGEEVYLLIPQNGNSGQWTHVRIIVSKFTHEEWPWHEPVSFKEMSIGEEQARATVTALAWSPPGLTKHRRSVLAVLTSNLILSLWASNANPTDVDSWERILIINEILSTISHLQQRIRSMAWAPTRTQHIDCRTPFSRRKWGTPFLAIADDSNGLYILKVSSPFAGQSLAWSVEVLHHKNVPVADSLNDRPSLLSLAMNANHFVDRIAFGKWNGDIPVMYRSSGTIHYASLSVHEGPPSGVRPEDASDIESLTVNLNEARPGDNNMPSRTEVTPLIKAQILAEKERFGLDNNIGSLVMLKTWGLASFNDLVAACVTLHPAKMVEYTAPTDGIATILFDAGDGNGNTESLFPWQSRAQVDVAKAQRAILDFVLEQSLQRPLALNNIDLKIMYTTFCGSLLLRDDKRVQRLEAAVKDLNLIEQHANINLPEEHRILLSINNSPQLTDQELIDVVRQMTKARGQADSSLSTPEKVLLDLCPFCPETQGIIPFDNFREAYCPQGHSFGRRFPLLIHPYLTSHAARCALTFIPLLEPGGTKRCFNCGREFIDEQSHPEIPMDLSQRLDPINISDSNGENIGAAQEYTGLVRPPLASMLFDNFDTCPYCGGKFCN